MKWNGAVSYCFVLLLPSPSTPRMGVAENEKEKEEEKEEERRLYVIGISPNCRMWGWAFYCVLL